MKVQACACNCVCLYYVLYCRLSFLMFLAEMHACKISPDHRNVWVMSSCSFCFSSLFPSGQIPRCTHGLAGGEWCSVYVWSVWEHQRLRRSFKHDVKVRDVVWLVFRVLWHVAGCSFYGRPVFKSDFCNCLTPSPLFLLLIYVCHISCQLFLVIKMKRPKICCDSKTRRLWFYSMML